MQIMDASPANGQHAGAVSPYAVLRRWQLPHGLAVAVALPRHDAEVPPEALAPLHPDERAWAAGQPPRRRVTWVGGRVALREALRGLGVDAGPIFATDRGAPALPAGVAGSVTHKAGAVAVALVGRQGEWRLGVDVEVLKPPRPGIARKVLTAAEQQCLAGRPADEFWHGVLVRFSMKEAIYKALDPFVCRYVDFDEVEIDLTPDGRAKVHMELRRGEGPFLVEGMAHFTGPEEVLTTARIRPA